MMRLSDFLKYVAEYSNSYILVTGEKLSLSLGFFMVKHPKNWHAYIVRDVKADNDDLIIEVRKPFEY